MSRTATAPPTDPRLWRLLLARAHPDAGGSGELFVWAQALREVLEDEPPPRQVCGRCNPAPREAAPAHDPARQEARRRAASKAGKSKPGRELTEAKRDILEVIKGVREETIERPVGAVVFQGYNVLLKALDVERRWRETDELETRLEEMEEALGHKDRGGGYGSTG